jgi:hypothetical protein
MSGWDRDYEDGQRVKRVWTRQGTVIDWSAPHSEGGAEYLVKWDGLGTPEWLKLDELEKGTKPEVSKDHKHFFEFETRPRNHPYFICKCGEFLSWDDTQDRLNQTG